MAAAAAGFSPSLSTSIPACLFSPPPPPRAGEITSGISLAPNLLGPTTGDCATPGCAYGRQQNAYQAWLSYEQSTNKMADLFVALGDNAYYTGSDPMYQCAARPALAGWDA